MVDEFSSFARMPKPTPERDDLVDVLRQTLFLMRLAHSGIEFRDNLPDGPLHAKFDRRLIGQAVQNILKNATEGIAAHVAGPDVEPDFQGLILLVLTETPDGMLAIDVIDNGIGFPPENRQRFAGALHDDARRGHGPRPRHRREDLRGTWRRHQPPRQSDGRARGPRADALPARAGREPECRCRPQERTGRKRWDLERMSTDILVVDDETDIRDLVAGILEDEGFRTRTARNADEALAEVQARRPNLIFLDIWLQGSRLDGCRCWSSSRRAIRRCRS